jgi:hypothetical protein
MRFSGHETFSCRATWLKKGLDFILTDGEIVASRFTQPEAATALGVGKNMVNSIRFWLYAFGIIKEFTDGELHLDPTVEAFIVEWDNEDADEPLDLFLEDPLTLWLLHYKLVTTNYATIYNFFFIHFIPRKSNDSFTEQEFLLALKSFIRSNGVSLPSLKTLESDFKVLLHMYAVKPDKASEIDDNALNILQPLEILSRQRLSKEKIVFYSINRSSLETVPMELIGMLILEYFKKLKVNSRSAELLFEEVGRPFCYGREPFFELLNKLEAEYPKLFTFSRSRNTGINEFQLRNSINALNRVNALEFLSISHLK